MFTVSAVASSHFDVIHYGRSNNCRSYKEQRYKGDVKLLHFRVPNKRNGIHVHREQFHVEHHTKGNAQRFHFIDIELVSKIRLNQQRYMSSNYTRSSVCFYVVMLTFTS